MDHWLYLLVFLAGKNVIKCSSDVKSSLTFVIDDTYSMSDDIEQVKINADAIFNTVMNSKSSQIEDFVLVTFNDPGISLRTVTKDRETFKTALKSISVHGGDDCPEMAMGGIELALQNSREASFLYVFTDASAKDHKMLATVEALSQKKRSQVVFVLTGDCGDRKSPEYLVYHKLARATQGQVFHMKRNEIGKILEYVKNTIKNRKNVITSKTFPAGHGNKFYVNVDGDTKELVISVAGVNPSVGVTDSSGTEVPTEDITRLREVAVVKVRGVKPGVYKVEVGSDSETSVVVSGTSTVHFQHGFSVFQPAAIEDTATRPVPGEKSHVSIKVSTEGGKVDLHSLQLLDLDDQVVLEAPLRLLDDAQQLYTTDAVLPPNHLFRIAIKGYHRESKTFITRISLTPIQPQDSPKVVVLEKAPSVHIDGSDKVEAKHNEQLQLKCKVSGYPRPDVIWESDDPTAVMSHNESVVELPYEYISFLHIENVQKKSSLYTCKAVNKLGADSKSIAVEVKYYFNVLEIPRDTAIEFKMRGQVFCKVDAFPPASVTWYRGRRPLAADAGVQLAADNSSLTISSMEPRLAGAYICEIRNDFYRKAFPFFVSITGIEAPKINKNFYYIEALKHSNVNITCNVFRGKPAPTVTWFYAAAEGSPRGNFTKLDENAATIHIPDVGMEHDGVFRCKVENVVGQDFHDIDLVVQYPPVQTGSTAARVLAAAGSAVTLQCPAAGAPPPAFKWRRNGAALPPAGYTVFRNGRLKFTASLSDSGDYECTAVNNHGAIHVNVRVEIYEPVSIEPPEHSRVSATVGAPLALPCRARGRPAPRLAWLFHSRDPGAAPAHYEPSDPSGSLHIKRIQSTQEGFYTCIASNVAGSTNITYTVSVLVPPSISYSAKRFVGVAGDVQLRLPCRAAGRPAPAIAWTRDGYPVPVGSRWYAVDADGALLLRDLDARAAGRYVCRAENSLGAATEAFSAVVLPSPAPAPPGAPVWLEEGQPAVVACDVPHRKTDRLLWFKDGHMIADGEMELKNVSRHDAGLYACRVSSLSEARTGSTQVEVGWKPRFTFNDEKYIEFEIGNFVIMSCEATGEPEPEILWLHDDVPLDVTSFTHELEMLGPGDRGRYTCIVSNKFGTVHREFEIDTFECALDIKKDFIGNEPLMLTRDLEINQFETSDGHVHVRRGETIALFCPAGFEKLTQNLIMVKCVNGKEFVAEDDRRRLSYSDLKCRQKIVPEIKRTGRRCVNGDSEMMNVGFQIRDQFVKVYQICLDRATKNTIYTKQVISLSQANDIPEYDIKWFDSDSPMNSDKLFDCSYQNRRISSILSKSFHGGDGCCFARRQLVSPRDVAPGPPQAATYAALNVAAQWGTCNSQNWEEAEARVRGLARAARRALPVWSGTARALRLRDSSDATRNVALSDGYVSYQVPEFFWKVVQDPARNASLAVVHVNVPDLQLRHAARYRLCEDVCAEVDWMRNRRWRELARGYTYCCRLPEFERAFGLRDVFPPRPALLRAVAYLADSSALHL